MEEVKPGMYQHYRGNVYEVIGIALHSETMEELVIYRAMYDSDRFGNNALWARPKIEFLENVKKDGTEVPRFKYIGRKI
jgi:hypothetical protein